MQHIIIAESQYGNVQRFNRFLSFFVVDDGVGCVVNLAIQFDSQSLGRAVKIKYEQANTMLSPELAAGQLAAFEVLP